MVVVNWRALLITISVLRSLLSCASFSAVAQTSRLYGNCAFFTGVRFVAWIYLISVIIRLNSNIFHKFHSCTSWVPFPAVMWACWSPPAATWNGYRRCKMAIRGRVEETQLGGRGDRLTKGPPSKVQPLEILHRWDLYHQVIYIM